MSKGRVEAFSDAVFAIIMTILVIEIHPPELTNLSLEGVFEGLHETLPHLVAFALPWAALAVAFFVNLYVGLALLALLFFVYNRIYSSRRSKKALPPGNRGSPTTQ